MKWNREVKTISGFIITRFGGIALFLFIQLFGVTRVLAVDNSQQPVYAFGVVPQFEARRLHAIWSPILKQLNDRTGYRFALKGAPTIADFEKAFMRGDYDFAYMNPYHYIIANKTQRYQPLLRDQGKKLFGVLVVRKDSHINDVSQLDGQKIAFPSPNALGAALQMRQELHDIFHIQIQPVYVKTHDSVYLNVLLGKTQAGGGVQKTLRSKPQAYQQSLKIIHKTRQVAPHPIVVHPRVPQKVKQAVFDAFLAMGRTEAGKKQLAKIPIKQIGAATHADYVPLLEMKLERFYVKPE